MRTAPDLPVKTALSGLYEMRKAKEGYITYYPTFGEAFHQQQLTYTYPSMKTFFSFPEVTNPSVWNDF